MRQCAITVFASEFGTFFNPRDREMTDALTALWDGRQGPFEKVTKTQGSDTIDNPWINLLACTTPKWIAENFPEYMVGGGFTARCILVYADTKRRLIAYPKDQLPPTFQMQEKALVHDLEVVSMLRGEFSLLPDAKAWGEAWYEEHWRTAPQKYDSEVYGNYLARKQTHIHKLAMILSAANRNDLKIRPDDLIDADREITKLESTMKTVFASIGQSVDAKRTMEVVEIMRFCKKLQYQALMKRVVNKMSAEEFKKAYDSACLAGLLESRGEGGGHYVHWKKQD